MFDAKKYIPGLGKYFKIKAEDVEGLDQDKNVVTKEYVDTELAKKANVNHTHPINQVNGLQAALDSKANTSHNHNNLYYTKSEVDNMISDLQAQIDELKGNG